MKTDVIAVASMMEVNDTAAPANGSTDRGNPSQANWTTRQVGGDEVYRSGWVGDVYDDVMKKVGFADYYGVYSTALPIPRVKQLCRVRWESSRRRQKGSTVLRATPSSAQERVRCASLPIPIE